MSTDRVPVGAGGPADGVSPFDAGSQLWGCRVWINADVSSGTRAAPST